MNIKKLSLAIAVFALVALAIPQSCTKNTNPQTIYDTVTIIKNDTTIKVQTDTVYGTKPDSTVNLSQGLLLYLNFSGNIADSSGNNNPTQAVGNVLTNDEHGYANSAFGGSGNQWIYVTNNGSIQFDTAWAISLAFMVNDNRLETFISMVDPTNGEGPSFNFGTTVSSPACYLACGSGDASIDCSSYAPVNTYNITDTTYWLPNPGSWYKAIVIYHKGIIQTYINGTLISTKVGSGTAALLCPNSQVVIGNFCIINGVSQPMNGKLDNVRLYNRVLTPHEIIALSANYQITSNSQRPVVRTAPVHKTF
jgi:hypothetical protein